MATNLTIPSAALSVGWAMTSDDNVGGKTNNSNTLAWALTSALTNGAGAGSASLIYVKSGTIAASANLDLDLAGSLTDFFGSTITFTKIKGIVLLHSTATTASSITLGGSVTAAITTLWTGTNPGLLIRNGYSFALLGSDAAGYVVTATTADILRITNNDGTNTATYSILIYGA